MGFLWGHDQGLSLAHVAGHRGLGAPSSAPIAPGTPRTSRAGERQRSRSVATPRKGPHIEPPGRLPARSPWPSALCRKIVMGAADRVVHADERENAGGHAANWAGTGRIPVSRAEPPIRRSAL